MHSHIRWWGWGLSYTCGGGLICILHRHISDAMHLGKNNRRIPLIWKTTNWMLQCVSHRLQVNTIFLQVDQDNTKLTQFPAQFFFFWRRNFLFITFAHLKVTINKLIQTSLMCPAHPLTVAGPSVYWESPALWLACTVSYWVCSWRPPWRRSSRLGGFLRTPSTSCLIEALTGVVAPSAWCIMFSSCLTGRYPESNICVSKSSSWYLKVVS